MVEFHNQISLQEPTLFESDPEFGLGLERLEPIVPERGEPQESESEPDVGTADCTGGSAETKDPGLVSVIEHLAPRNRELHVPPRIEPFGIDYLDSDTVMIGQAEAGEATEKTDVNPGNERSRFRPNVQSKPELKGSPGSHGAGFDPHELQEKASASLREHEAAAKMRDVADEGSLEKRHDSHQEQEPPLSPDRTQSGSRRASPCLRLDTQRELAKEDSITTSPNLSKHVITMSDDIPETLPAFQHHSPTREGSAGSPQDAILPPIHQIVTTQQLRPLDELAEAAAIQQDPRYAHQHRPSFGSATSPSPILPYHPYAVHMQMSPSSQHAYSARSPTSGFEYGSPTQYAHPTAYYTNRRTSAPADQPPGPPPSLPSVSSGESHGAASSADGYSTAHTTPIDVPDATPRPMLPPPPGMIIAPGYKCDFSGCQAPPFQTQYLLRFVWLLACYAKSPSNVISSSHKNVHTNLRPHYCPVKECPRSEGGKGFKRKNEMIRHGLVHESPGYVCPFCPDREHRYPRPDNLQRYAAAHSPQLSL